MGDQVKRLRPLGTMVRVDVGADDAVVGGAAFDGFDGSIGHTLRTASMIFSASEGFAVRVLLVEIKSVRFPVLVQAEIQIELRLAFQPRDVRAHLGGFRIAGNRGSNQCRRRSRAGSSVKPAGFKHGSRKIPRSPASGFPESIAAPRAARRVRRHECRR